MFVLIIVTSLGCIEFKKPPTTNQSEIAKPSVTPTPNETKPLTINDTFETWSRGYWSNASYKQPYFRVITNYSSWIAFLDEQGYFAWQRGEIGMRLEGQLFPGLNVMPKTIAPADFNNYFIIAAMMGLRAIAEEPEIEIKNISRINDTINVTVRMHESSFGEMVESAPYHIVIVKRELLPVGNSTFVLIDTEGKMLGKLEIEHPATAQIPTPATTKQTTVPFTPVVTAAKPTPKIPAFEALSAIAALAAVLLIRRR